MATMAQFSRNIRRRGQQVENASARIVRRMGRKALKSLVVETPVDTGRARSNWRVGIGAPTRMEIEPYAPGRHLGRAETSNAAAAIAAGYERINTLRPGRGRRLQTALYITNNTKYIEKLNEGYSPQTPPGFIQRSVAQARQEIANFRIFSVSPSDGD